MSARFRPAHLIALVAVVWVLSLPDIFEMDRGQAVGRLWDLPIEQRVQRSFPRQFGRGDGEPVGIWIPSRPTRIVAASVLSAEVLVAIAQRQQIAAVLFLAADARYSMAADEVVGLPTVGATPEQLLSARPDLVITDPYTQSETQILLEAAGVTVVRTGAVRDFADVIDNIRMIGWVTGCDVPAEHLVEDVQRRLAAAADIAAADVAAADAAAGSPALGAWRVMNLNGALDTYGRGSLFSAAVRRAGAVNLPDQFGIGAYQPLDIETVLGWRPDAIVVVADSTEPALPPWLASHPGLRLLPCSRRGRIVQIPGAILASTSHHAVEITVMLQAQLREWGTP